MEEERVPRNINKPLIVPWLGLEVRELGITVMFIFPFLCLVMPATWAVIIVVVGNIIYAKLRKGKPPGWVWHRFYKTGLPLSAMPGLLNAKIRRYEISPGPYKEKGLSIFGKEEKILRSIGG